MSGLCRTAAARLLIVGILLFEALAPGVALAVERVDLRRADSPAGYGEGGETSSQRVIPNQVGRHTSAVQPAIVPGALQSPLPTPVPAAAGEEGKPVSEPFPALKLPETAKSVAELVPAHLPVITATLDLAGQEEVAQVLPSGAAVTFLGGRVTLIADKGAFTETVNLSLRDLPVETKEEQNTNAESGAAWGPRPVSDSEPVFRTLTNDKSA